MFLNVMRREYLHVREHLRVFRSKASSPPPPACWPDLNPSGFYLWKQLKTIQHSATIENEETLHQRILNACQNILFLRGRHSVLRRGHVYVGSGGRYFKRLFCIVTR